MKFILSLTLFTAFFSVFTPMAFATPDCHPGYYGRCNENESNPGFAWYRTVSSAVECFADDAPAGSAPSDQRNCSPHGFGLYLSADGYNHCYSVDAPQGAASVDLSYCQ